MHFEKEREVLHIIKRDSEVIMIASLKKCRLGTCRTCREERKAANQRETISMSDIPQVNLQVVFTEFTPTWGALVRFEAAV